MKPQTLARSRRTGLALLGTAALALAAFAGAGAAFGAFSADAGLPDPVPAAAPSDPVQTSTTVTIRTPDTDGPLEMNLDGLKEGEARTFKTSTGKAVVVTRAGEGYTVKVGDKTIPIDVAGGKDVKIELREGRSSSSSSSSHVESADGSGKFVVLTEDVSGVPCADDPATGNKKCIEKRIVLVNDGAPLSAKGILEKAKPASYDALDARTKESVEKVLQELLDKKAMPGAHGVHFVTSGAGTVDGPDGGDNVEVKVIRRKVESK